MRSSDGGLLVITILGLQVNFLGLHLNDLGSELYNLGLQGKCACTQLDHLELQWNYLEL